MRAPLTPLLAALIAAPLGAQRAALGSLHGTLQEKAESRSVRTASVSIVRADAEPSGTINVRPDAKGEFHVDSLLPGRYLVQVSSPTLDSLEVALPAERIDVAAGKSAHFDFILPFGEELRNTVCHGLRLGEGKGVIAGRALDADTDKPLAGADVAAAWTHNYIDKTTLKVVTQTRGSSVKAGANGEYRMCGVPSGTTISLQLQHEGRASSLVRVVVSDDEGAVVRDLSLSPTTSPTKAALDSVARLLAIHGRDSTRDELELVGTSSITGVVRSLTSEPVAGAEVRVRDARSTATTDSAGRYTLAGLPAGTQLLVIRQLGYPITEIPVELRANRSVQRDVLLRRNVVLDSVRVVGTRNEYPEFERNRRTNSFGQFIDAKEIAKMHADETADLFYNILGFSVFGKGSQARIISNSALARHPECRSASIVVNGSEGWSLNNFAPDQIAGVEAYADETFVPARFQGDQSKCGVIVIWLRKKSSRAMPPMGLSGNGYP